MTLFTVVPLFIVGYYALTDGDGILRWTIWPPSAATEMVFARSLLLVSLPRSSAWSFAFRWAISSPACG